ncbi:hypothetical protein N431DRAFT_460772 [Stipitochalara longipes BDJ]|nr:hypothetical protein N431DRAFT_460772 [Stipitochalara longipes BDJ]
MHSFDEENSDPMLEKGLLDGDDFFLPTFEYQQDVFGSLFNILREWTWQISTTILLFISFGLLLRLHQVTTNTYETGFKTDLQAITNHIELEEVVFENQVVLSDTGQLVRVPGDGPQYVGEPSEAIDDAWRNLLIGLNVDLKGSEADDIRDKTFQWPKSDVSYSGVDLFHSLHCLNEIRKFLYPEYYAEKDPTEAEKRVERVHQEHCLDYIRQSLQCGGDLTPMNWVWIEQTQKVFFKPGTPHTCRKFDAVWQWVEERKVDWSSEEKNGYFF